MVDATTFRYSDTGREEINYYNPKHEVIRREFGDGIQELMEYDLYGNRISHTDRNGSTTSYVYGKNGLLLEKHSPEGLVTCYAYDEAGRLTGESDNTGEQKKLVYDQAGRLIQESVLTDNNRYSTTTYTRDGYGRMLTMTDALGNTTKYAYEENIDQPTQVDTPEGYMYRYSYDRAGRRTKITTDHGTKELCYSETGAVSMETDALGNSTRYFYDSAGNMLKSIRPNQYDEQGDNGAGIRYTYDKENRLTAIHDEEGRTFRRFVYDKKGRLTESVEGEARFGTRYVYDAAGRPVQKWVPVRTEPDAADREPAVLCNVTLYEYDPAGNRILERRSPDEVREGSMPVHFLDIRMSYDRQNRLVQVEDSLGAAASYTYDCLNNRLTEKYRVNETAYRLICYKYDAAGRLTDRMESVDPEDVGQETGPYCKKAFLHTRYEYDRNGNMIRLQLPNGGEVTRDYDIMDRIVRESIRDEKSGTDTSVTFTYDAAGRPTARTTQDGEVHRCSYDNCGRLIAETDEEGAVTRYFHNKNGELIKAVSADNYDSTTDNGAGYTFAYDVFGRLSEVRDAFGQLCEENAYDEAGRLKSRYDAAGCVLHNEYDLGGRKSAVYDGEEKKPLQTYTYDSLGNITGITDGEQNHTEFELDAWGRITGITNPDGSRESYTYDHAGNITSTTDGRGGVIRYDYNSMLKPGKVTDQAGNADTFTYDGEGNPAGQTDRNGKTIRREYGSFGLLLSEQGEDGTFNRRKYDRQGRLTENASNHISYRYDYTRTGRLKTRYINGKAALRYTYTKAGRTASITDICGKTTEYGYDLNGRITEVSEKGKVLAAYTYDAAGRVKNITFANGMQTLYAYDRERNLASVETKNADGSILLSYSYQYDRNGNRTEKKDLKNGNSTTYLYDTMQRLSEAAYPETGKETYRYDEAGNRIQKQTQSYVEDYLYDERNRLTQKSVKNSTIKNSTNPDSSEADNTNITTYQYDLQGSLIREQSTDLCRQYLYNDFHQCIQTDVIRGREEEAERLVQQNFYDGEGLRFALIENGSNTGFITDGWNNVTEFDGNGRVRKRIIRGMGIAASEDTEQKEDNIFTTAYHYYHGNERMDVEYITDEAGSVRNSYAYDAFGGIISSKETIPNRYTYNGESYDKTTEQYYLRKRFYNPKLCRFTQEDEYRGDGLNLYAFCANNPVMYVDPSGYEEIPIPGDYNYSGPLPDNSWRLTKRGAGAHLVERVNTRGRSDLAIYDKSYTPRYYPYGSPENAGQAHKRLHSATKVQGIRLQGGNPGVSSKELMKMYERAYSNDSLNGIKGDLRTPNSKTVIAQDVNPKEAFEALKEWGKKEKAKKSSKCLEG